MTNIPFGDDGGRALAQPGRVYPLRRIGLGEVLGGGFSLVRHSPKAVLGVPFAAGLASFLVALLLFVVFPDSGFFRMIYDPMAFEDPDVAAGAFAEWTFLVVLLIMGLLQNIVLSIGYAMVIIPVLRSAYGFRTGFGQTFRIAAGRLGPLVVHVLVMAVLITLITAVTGGVVIGLLVLTGAGAGVLPAVLLGLLMIPAVLLLICWLTVGLMYAPMVVLVERRGPLEAIARSWTLNNGLWWRNIGTLALIMVLMIAVLSVLTMPVSILMGVGMSAAWMSGDPETGNLLSFAMLAGTTFLDSVLTAVLLGLVAAMVSLIYVNCRIRRESFDVALLTAAEQTLDDGEVVPGSVAHLGEPRHAPQEAGGAAGQYGYGQYDYGQHSQYDAGQYGYGQHPGHHASPWQAPGGQNPHQGYDARQHGQGPYGQPGQQHPQWGPHSGYGGPAGRGDGSQGTPGEQNGPHR